MSQTPTNIQDRREQSPGDEGVDRRAMLGLAGLAGVAGMAMLAGKAGAGPLVPPAGPITSTGKTLSEVEPRRAITSVPFTIVAPGSYYLTGNLAVSNTVADAITISSDNVTIDLNGFTISGGRTGIFSQASLNQITIRNGAIRDTAGSGIFLSFADRMVIRDLSIIGHRDAAIFVVGQGLIERVVTIGSLGSTTSTGITVGSFSRVSDCSVRAVALRGISVGFGSQVERCNVANAGTDGIAAGGAGKVSECNVTSCGEAGVLVGQRSVVMNTLCSEVGRGMEVEFGSVVSDVTVTNCTGDGFLLTQGSCSLTRCVVTFAIENAFNAINTGTNTFESCHAKDVGLNGFQVGGGCVIRHCSVTATGNLSSTGTVVSSGVLIDGNECIVEDNRFLACGFPVFIPVGRLRNSVFGNRAVECTNSYGNAAGPSNILGNIRINAAPVNSSDNVVVT